MLINLSNHPSVNWSEKQITLANKKFGKIIDISFPAISPTATRYQVNRIAEMFYKKCSKLIGSSTDKYSAVHVMGELTFTFALVVLLKKKEINCIASTTNRNVKELSSSKVSFFSFVNFREY